MHENRLTPPHVRRHVHFLAPVLGRLCKNTFSGPLKSMSWLILHTPGPEIPDLAYHIHSLLTLLTQLLTLLRHMIPQWFQPKWHTGMILQWFQPKWLSMALCIHGKTILLILLRLLTCHHINVSKMSNLSRGQNSYMNMPTHKQTSNIDIIWVYT